MLFRSRNSRLGRTIPNQPAAPATPGSPVVDLQYKKREASLLLLYGFRQRPTLPGRVQPSTIGAEGLNFCVRYGNRWDPFAIITGNCELFSTNSLRYLQQCYATISCLICQYFSLKVLDKPHSYHCLPRTLTTAQLFDLNFLAFSPISLPDFACNQALDRLVSSSCIRYRTSTDDLSTW